MRSTGPSRLLRYYGLAYLHARKPNAVIHRDIKPLNSLIYLKGLRLKICDFGTVVDLSKSMTVDVGTCRYKAPEVLRGRHYNEKCDVHSWAITFWEILSRKTPLEEHRGTYALKLAINGGDRPSFEDIMPGCPGDIISILSACWNVDPQKRHSMELVTYIMRKFVSEAGPIDPIDFQWPTL
ncbi:mitogen-activated protein kinase kinase kinase 7 isoform X2 [Drosophila eugracilis]|uniref:mitogen-activated protein kinase kinase kinase 7 isoform X2 n=1 Tax=Drosophila eugracilis TaxID=29029 RepID=UPI0007E5F8BC|nr:mitogen-activated protein kinase kinase kinase 7 isoform X2 [Drosophila eugracilis]